MDNKSVKKAGTSADNLRIQFTLNDVNELKMK